MTNTEGSTSEPICVLFREAIAWIAVRNFTEAVAIGPRPFRLLPFGEEDDEEYRIAEGRCMLAQQLLIDYGAKGRIRIYADHGWSKDGQVSEDMSSPVQLATDFLSTAEYGVDYHIGDTLYVPEDRGYYYLAVNYDDLIREFWGDAAPSITIREPTARPERGTVPLRRRGRRPLHPWPDFVAELVRVLLYGPPFKNQAALERHMAEWCATTWGVEPAASEIRKWVRPAFRIISGSSAAARAPNGRADDWSPENTEAVDE
jgi:hypothetical protein